jgi:antirestriction protein ArdC
MTDPQLSKTKGSEMAARVDFRQRLTSTLVQALEEHDGLPWRQSAQGMRTRSFNPVSGVKYKGGNAIGLLLAQLQRGSEDPRWMTLKQANKAGYSIRAGAKATYVEYWDWGVPGLTTGKPIAEAQALADEETEEQARARTKPRVFYAAVFNGEDVVGLPALELDDALQPIELAKKLIAATGAEIEHVQSSRPNGRIVYNAAYYERRADKVIVPPRSDFKSDADYFATVLHQVSKWTGHSSRLNRQAPEEQFPFGSPEYAREALRVEIATHLMTSMLGLDGQAKNHVETYGKAWLDILKSDRHEIFRATRDAEQIVDHLFGYVPELREIVERNLAANVLPEGSAKRRLNVPISDDMPNFIPAGLEPTAPVVRVGRADPRWAGFEEALLQTAKKSGLPVENVTPVFDMIEPNFTTIMDGMKSRGLDEDMVYKMIGAQIIEEMKQADVHHQNWSNFAASVRTAATGIEVEVLESALQEISQRYQQKMVEAVNGRWDEPTTLTELNQVLYGQEGHGIAIDRAFVQRLVAASDFAHKLAAPQVDDEDDVLMPLGMSDVLPEDAGIQDDERLSHASP